MKLFDFHLHPFYDFGREAASPEEFAADLRRYGTVMCAGSVIHQADSKRPVQDYAEILPRLNREAFALHERMPDFYVPGIHIHPEFVELSCRELDHYAARGVKLVGEQVHYLMGWTCYTDKRMFAIMEHARSLNMVVNFHPKKKPEDMEPLFAAFPRLQFVVAHLDGYGLYDFAIEMMRKYENVSFDISAYGAAREGMIADAVSKVGSSRILYGTDYPGYEPRPFIDAVLQADITDDDRENIFYRNAARLLGVDAVQKSGK